MRNAFPLSPSLFLPQKLRGTCGRRALHVPLGRGGGLGLIIRLKGSRVLVSTLIAPRSPLLAQAAWHCCAARIGSASQTVASQPLASRALVASQLVCFADSVLRASVSASHSSFTVRHCCQSARSTFIVLCRWAVHGYGIRTTPQYSTLECSVLASGISAGFDAALGHYPFTPILLRANLLWWPVRALRRGGTGG